ncbi:hypothetical protein QN277_018739 [Acacia crassicarpa]|uniref:Phospholipase A2 family protein n=1 Tax=Acacia crassicarpa TaxID=499986 RepID=A0AAE1JV84_9FABA|nr:hypothetical protein QN277_018739 [Acacia crassicarpa]
MNFGFLSNAPWSNTQSKTDSWADSKSMIALREQPKEVSHNDIRLFGWVFSILRFFPWSGNAGDRIQRPTTINRGLKRRAQTRGNVENGMEVTPLRFRPYVSKVPWHTGARGFLSQLFPRYGNYCGPNWSSGKDHGSPVWDRRPIDWLDFCCYCHDIGYDTHDQAELLKADLAFLECLESRNMSTKGDPHVALLYKTMCINGLKNVLIPYRRNILSLQAGQPLVQFGWLSNLRWRS